MELRVVWRTVLSRLFLDTKSKYVRMMVFIS